MHKYKNNLLPPTFENVYQTNSSYHRYPTRKANHLRGPKTRIKIAQTFIRNAGALIWNELSAQIDHNKSIGLIKKDFNAIFTAQYGM